MSAVISACGLYRYRLDRAMLQPGIVFAYAGVNPSKAGPVVEDQTTLKWRGFTVRNGGSRYIAINPYAYRATSVQELAGVADPVGPDNPRYIREVIAEADVLVPCWGNTHKVPPRLRHRFAELLALMRNSGKPIRIFGLTQTGDPKHPLMLGYDTPLQDWTQPDAKEPR